LNTYKELFGLLLATLTVEPCLHAAFVTTVALVFTTRTHGRISPDTCRTRFRATTTCFMQAFAAITCCSGSSLKDQQSAKQKFQSRKKAARERRKKKKGESYADRYRMICFRVERSMLMTALAFVTKRDRVTWKVIAQKFYCEASCGVLCVYKYFQI